MHLLPAIPACSQQFKITSMLKLSYRLSQILRVTCSMVLGLVSPSSKCEQSTSGSTLAFVLCNLNPCSDGTAFAGVWGRPQADGPALRATALAAYSRWLIRNGGISTVTSAIWPIISNDLNYVAQYWNQTTFDIWEETRGMYIFEVDFYILDFFRVVTCVEGTKSSN